MSSEQRVSGPAGDTLWGCCCRASSPSSSSSSGTSSNESSTPPTLSPPISSVSTMHASSLSSSASLSDSASPSYAGGEDGGAAGGEGAPGVSSVSFKRVQNVSLASAMRKWESRCTYVLVRPRVVSLTECRASSTSGVLTGRARPPAHHPYCPLYAHQPRARPPDLESNPTRSIGIVVSVPPADVAVVARVERER